MARQNRPKLFVTPSKCDGKIRYGSEHEAEHVKEEQELLVLGLELKVYRCNRGCGGWHLTRVKR